MKQRPRSENARTRTQTPHARRVLQAIEELGFARNAAARGLAAGMSSSVGIIVVDLDNSLFLRMIRGAEREAEEREMNVLLSNSDIRLKRQNDSLRLFDEMRLAGIILAPLEGNLGLFAVVRGHGRPTVLLNHPGDGNCCGVVVDEELGGYLAARHLIAKGRVAAPSSGRKDTRSSPSD